MLVHTAMKILIICFLLSTLGLTFAVPAFNLDSFLQPRSSKEQNKNEVSALLQVLASTENDQDTDDDEDDGTVANLQGLFNVMAQVEVEKAKQQQDKNVAMVQFWGGLGSVLWNAGKGYLKKRYCTEEEEVRAMLQELIGEQEVQDDEDDGDGDDKVRTELQTLFNALKKAEAKVMQDDTSDDTAKAEGWFKKLKRWAKKKTKGLTKKYLC